jgi:Ala-tRNA(Pro) deacylase
MMISTEDELLRYLDRLGIDYQRFEHPPVFTCEQADLVRPGLPGVSTKNLFLRDKQKRFYLVMTACEKKLDLKKLGQALGAAKLHFGSEESLMELLHLTPGSVTVLGLVNDIQHRVELWIDQEIWQENDFLCHPLVNTATLVLPKADLIRIIELSGHPLHFIRLEI